MIPAVVAPLLALTLAAAAPAPAVTAAPNVVSLASLELTPSDSLARRAFLRAFRDLFREARFGTERDGARSGEVVLAAPLTNRFQLLEGSAMPNAWQVQLIVAPAAAVPPAPRVRTGAAKRGTGADSGRTAPVTPAARPPRRVQFTLAVLSPAAAQAGARPIPQHFTVAFPAQDPNTLAWEDLGRAAALLALEGLHHANDDLDAEIRLKLEPARRLPAGKR